MLESPWGLFTTDMCLPQYQGTILSKTISIVFRENFYTTLDLTWEGALLLGMNFISLEEEALELESKAESYREPWIADDLAQAV